MPYVTSFERIGIKKGVKKGLVTGLEEAVEAVLEARFGKKGVQLLAKVDLPKDFRGLRRLRRNLLGAQSLGEAASLVGKAAARVGKRS